MSCKVFLMKPNQSILGEEGVLLCTVENQPNIYDVLKYKNKFYRVVTRDINQEKVQVKETEFEVEPSSIEYSRDFQCPYCKNIDRDAWELSGDSDETQCGSCGSYIEYERVVTVEYNTYPKKCTTVRKVG